MEETVSLIANSVTEMIQRWDNDNWDNIVSATTTTLAQYRKKWDNNTNGTIT